MADEQVTSGRSGLRGLGRNVIILGVVSLLTDVSSEMLYPVIPLFLTSALGASMTVVGLIEGAAEGAASALKMLFGWISDRTARRKPFVVWGYGLSAVSKPMMALAGAWPFVLLARLVDRTGKGMRTSPRDALIAASCSAEQRGTAFGLHRAMDTAGAVAGPVLAMLFLSVWGLGYRAMFLLAFIPAALGVLALAFVRAGPAEAGRAAPPRPDRPPLRPALKRFVAVYGLFALGNSSDVFLLLRAKEAGLGEQGMLLVYVFYNAVYALASTPAGWLSDRFSRRTVMAGGLAVFAAVYLGFALDPAPARIWLLFALYGFYAAAMEGVAKAQVADLSAPENRGTAMGLLHSVTGLLAFVASAAAGWLWAEVSPAAPFYYGAACALAAAGLLLLERPGGKA
ncbi:MAG TPA: MFS transporter [Kiritimatiellia bacterium]|nr:MFS transporter [Kiritimatiellia bacterium]HRZ12238.1 MFS transporter [Kiritimatiellia bacterium]HSA18004.1 MFS transporter [Kiritimatiellia bacterium]